MLSGVARPFGRVAFDYDALVGCEAVVHPAVLLPGRADSDSSGSSRVSAPRVSDAAIFDRRSLVAEFADDKCRGGGIQSALTIG
jgi:hypothetical protein